LSQLMVNRDAVKSRCSELARRLAGDGRTVSQFTGRSGAALTEGDGVMAGDSERFARAVAATVLAAIDVVDNLQKFLDGASDRLGIIDRNSVIRVEQSPVTVNPAPAPGGGR